MICGGGTSASKPGFNTNVVITAAAVEGALALAGLEVVAAILAPIIAPTVLELTTFCTTDPPADPGIDGTDIIAATNFTDPLNAIAAQDKIRQWFMANYWYTVCECTSASTPAAPGFSSPTTPPSSNPGLPPGVTGQLCWDITDTVTLGTSSGVIELPQFIPDGAQHGIVNQPVTGHTGIARAMPAGVNSGFTVLTIDHTDPTHSEDITISFYNASNTLVGITQIWDGPSTVTDFRNSFTVPSGATQWIVWASNPSTTEQFTFTMRFAFACSGQSSNNPTTPCCPPDPLVESKLDQIMQLLVSVFQSLPSAPSSYSDGTAHTGLSGNGTVTLAADVLAVRVNITTDPANLGTSSGTPTPLFDRGFIVPIVNAAPIRADTRLIYNPQMFPLPALTEQIGYSLHPGVVATITELLRGP